MKNYSTLEETLAAITPLDEKAIKTAQKRWDSIAKPLHSLGKLETLLVRDSRELQEIRILIFPEEHWLPCVRITELWKRE